MNKKAIGISLILIVAVFLGFSVFREKISPKSENNNTENSTVVYVAAGGGKEDYLADEDILKILKDKYNIVPVYDTWSNGKTISKPLIREYVGLGNESIARAMSNGENYTIKSEGVSKYDALFTSDQRFYDYYKLAPKDGEAERYTVLDGGMMLNTPIVMYSWKEAVKPLMDAGIVTQEDGVYYISDMEQMISIILEGVKWKDVGLDIYGNINIKSTDPITSSPGATYYGLLLAIMSGGEIDDSTIEENLQRLSYFYKKSGYMNNTPADLFERYLKTGVGGEAIIVDYEKSLINFINSNPNGFAQIKDDIVVLYPKPTIWNSHCYLAFTENGKKLYHALQDEEISQIAWERYGFRTGTANSDYDVSNLGITVPQTIRNTVSSLKMDQYNQLIDYLKNNQ